MSFPVNNLRKSAEAVPSAAKPLNPKTCKALVPIPAFLPVKNGSNFFIPQILAITSPAMGIVSVDSISTQSCPVI